MCYALFVLAAALKETHGKTNPNLPVRASTFRKEPMGLYDYILCEYPLPGEPPEIAIRAFFQTKDLACCMHNYTITAEGLLREDDGEDDRSTFTGTINFYTSNVTAQGPGIYTATGEDAVYVEYQALFIDGKVSEIKLVDLSRQRAARSDIHKPRPLPTKEEVVAMEARRGERLTGKTIYVRWGGQAEGYPAEVIAENDKDLVCQKKSGEFEIIPRFQRDNIFFDCQEDASKHEADRKAAWDAKRAEFEAAIAEPQKA